MLLPDCKCRSGFFAVIRLLPLLLLLFPLIFLWFRLLLRCSRCSSRRFFAGSFAGFPPAVPCCFMPSHAAPYRPVQLLFRARNPNWGPCERPLQHSVTAALLPYRTCYAASGREILRGIVARLPGRQARTSTGYGFGRRRVSVPCFPTDALRFRLFSKGILPAATVSCTRNCGGRSPASSW